MNFLEFDQMLKTHFVAQRGRLHRFSTHRWGGRRVVLGQHRIQMVYDRNPFLVHLKGADRIVAAINRARRAGNPVPGWARKPPALVRSGGAPMTRGVVIE